MQLSYGLEPSFVDKNKHVKNNLAANFISLAQLTNEYITDERKEDYHEFLRAYCDIFTKNIYNSKDFTYNNLKRLIKDENVVVILGDKDSCVVIMNKTNYVQKLQNMIDEAIEKYANSSDNTLKDLKHFQDFFYRHFKKYKHYDRMCASSNTPAKFYGTAKTHKFENISNVTVDSLKFRPTIAQTGTCMYNVAQVISEYLKPLHKQ